MKSEMRPTPPTAVQGERARRECVGPLLTPPCPRCGATPWHHPQTMAGGRRGTSASPSCSVSPSCCCCWARAALEAAPPPHPCRSYDWQSPPHQASRHVRGSENRARASCCCDGAGSCCSCGHCRHSLGHHEKSGAVSELPGPANRQEHQHALPFGMVGEKNRLCRPDTHFQLILPRATNTAMDSDTGMVNCCLP
jgi:hypothetical protein